MPDHELKRGTVIVVGLVGVLVLGEVIENLSGVLALGYLVCENVNILQSFMQQCLP